MMGLLEKALQFKKEVNQQGRETLLDRIDGPASTEFITPALDDGDAVNPDPEDSLPEIDTIADVYDSTIMDDDIPSERAVNPDDFFDEFIATDEPADGGDDDMFQLPEEDDEPVQFAKDEPEKETATLEPEVAEKSALSQNDDDPFGPEDEPAVLQKDNAEPVVTGKEDADIPEKPATYQEEGSHTESKEFTSADNARPSIVAEEHGESANDTEMEERVLDESPYVDVPEVDAEESVISSTPRIHAIESDAPPAPLYETDTDALPYRVLFEMARDIASVKNFSELYDILNFSLMGQVGVTTSALFVHDIETGRCILEGARGAVVLEDETALSREGVVELLSRSGKPLEVSLLENNPAYENDLAVLYSLGASLLVPLGHGTDMAGVLVCGEPLAGDRFSDEDLQFLEQINSVAEPVLTRLITMARKSNNLENVNIEYDRQRRVVTMMRSLKDARSGEQTVERIQRFFEREGVEGFALFTGDGEGSFHCIVTDSDDMFGIAERNSAITDKIQLLGLLREDASIIDIAEENRTQLLSGIVPEKTLRWISIARVYPVFVASALYGFLVVLKTTGDCDMPTLDSRMKTAADMIISVLSARQAYHGLHSAEQDLMAPLYRRIEKEVSRASSLGIPLGLVMMSVKNLKRVAALHGEEMARSVMDSLKRSVQSRLSDSDFMARLDRNRILIVLPGKDRKYMVPFATAIQNEVIQDSSHRSMQLLVTYLSAAYPADGESAGSLLDILD